MRKDRLAIFDGKTGARKALVNVAVAQQAADRERGLMGVRLLAVDAGMLFVFPVAARWSIWMKNTPLRLAVAFIDANDRVLEIHQPKPMSTDLVMPRSPVKFALEVNEAFAKRYIRRGDKIAVA